VRENVGREDQALRSVAGPAIMAMGLWKLGANRGKPAGLAALIGGALILESAITRVCPVNKALGIDTRRH
jgi:hypothetical protein